jgi:alpha-L-fucosidase
MDLYPWQYVPLSYRYSDLTWLVGLSFGYNKQELESHSLNGKQAATLLVDVVSRGADLLLNVGPDAEGNIPPVQRRCLEDLAKWIKIYGEAIFGTTRVEEDIALPTGIPGENWVRWTKKGNLVFAFVDAGDAETAVRLPFSADKLDIKSAKLLGGGPVRVDREGNFKLEQLGNVLRPACIQFHVT